MIIVDTGVLVAVANAMDVHHARCLALLETHPGPLIVPQTVLTEVCWLLGTVDGPDSVAVLLNSFVDGPCELMALTAADLGRISQLVIEQRLDMVDASIVAIAERINAVELASLDRGLFSAVRAKHVDAFAVLP
jgi:uncharacterized protein